MKSILIITAALALGACGSGDEVESRSDIVTVDSDAPAAPIAMGDAKPDAGATTAASGSTIPERFRGAWDWHRGQCDSASENYMTVRADRIDYNGAVGKVTSVRQQGQSVLVDLALSDDSDQWTATQRLSLDLERDQLTSSDPTGAARDIDIHRRCS